MKLPAILCLGLLAFTATQAPVDAQTTCGSRVRRNWNALSDSDKATYKGAIAAAMDSGAYIKFVEIHQETMSNLEAHKQCMFLYWHRYFLVAFENMLRAQGDEFACVTLPYFNWMDANSRQLDGKCKYYGDCAAITTELGGFTSGSMQTLTVNSASASGLCVNKWPLDHFCQSSTPGTDCAGCVPRGDWGSTPLDGPTGFASVYSQVVTNKTIAGVSDAIERGGHGSVHSDLGGIMGNFASPADPIFWSHHSMVDALHTIFHKCRVGTKRMTFEEKASDPVAWSSCNRRNGGPPFKPTDTVTVRTGTDPNSVSATQDSVVDQFFEGVPNRFADLMDVRDLGDFSYSYELSGQLASMYTDCDGSQTTTSAPIATTSAPAPTTSAPPSTTSAPAPTTSAPPSTTSAPTTNAAEPITDASEPTTNAPQVTIAPSAATPTSTGAPSLDNLQMEDVRRFFDNLWGNLFPNTTPNFRKLAAEDEMGDTNAITQQIDTSMPAPSKSVKDDGKVDVIIVDKCGESEQRVMDWYQQTATAMGGLSVDTIVDLERQSCMYHDQCLGGVANFSDEFKATWGVKEARCKTIVDAVKCGAQSIVYGKWREDMEAHFGCPVPADTKSPASQGQPSQTQQEQQQQVQQQQVQQQQTPDGNIADAITGAIAQFTLSA
ncbi:Tyrosinase [Phytophthora ramorum]|uniref:Tyrosinase n=1 Tax=Phytophthora ramorum TaxID=164328 RepID=UPI0030A3A2C0|nr:Tyrosinase [Phytophthora ramorum]